MSIQNKNLEKKIRVLENEINRIVEKQTQFSELTTSLKELLMLCKDNINTNTGDIKTHSENISSIIGIMDRIIGSSDASSMNLENITKSFITIQKIQNEDRDAINAIVNHINEKEKITLWKVLRLLS
jgi:chromosome segregation ATPase